MFVGCASSTELAEMSQDAEIYDSTVLIFAKYGLLIKKLSQSRTIVKFI